MYTDEDLYSAVKAGVLEEKAVESFRSFMEQNSNTRAVDEENFRLISGFNDVFVAIASLLFLISSAWLSSWISKPLGYLVAALISWFLAIYFVQKRRLALPAIVFLGAYIFGIFGFSMEFLLQQGHLREETAIIISCAFTAIMTWIHWLKFKVPITVAAGIGCLSALFISISAELFSESHNYIYYVVLVCGLLSFSVAMYWDAQDTERKTRKSDVAFWLHLIAAPLIVHPFFLLLGIKDSDVSAVAIISVILMYFVLGIVSIAIDRRALMVSALAYVIYAFAELFKSYGAVSNGFAISGVFIGAMLIFLSAAWHPVRKRLLNLFPEQINRHVPVAK